MKIIDWFEQGFIPGLLYFQNGGEHTGSIKDFESKATKEYRYRIESNLKEGTIKAMAWYGPCCFQKSEIIEQAEFKLNESGRNNMLRWMKEKYESMIE